MHFDKNVPTLLKNTQEWFASIITSPIDINSKMNPVSPRGLRVEDEATQFIAPSPTLKPHERIQLYNQQYWWRLMSTLQESFPLVLRLFGYEDFNMSIAMPYLQKYPPNHWSLTHLGQHMARWVNEDYDAPDKELVRDGAAVDWAFNTIFIAKRCQPLDVQQVNQDDVSMLLSQKLYLQPFVDIFSFNYNLFEFRRKMLKEKPEHWLEHDFPELASERPYYFVLFRTKKNNPSWDEISAGEYQLLSSFKKGATVEEACQLLEDTSQDVFSDSQKHIAEWFQTWVVRQWLIPQMPS